ncbi:MAG: hypothetical protein KTR31_12500 [Myxococcales bacterium]|nr:hypothetical protein [Myxococcales bacterium]
MLITRLLGVAVGLALATACANQVDRFTIDKVLDRGTDHPDVDMVCEIGSALAHPMGAFPRREPDRAMVIAETVAAMCWQRRAWETELDRERAKANLGSLGDARANEIVDARIRGERQHSLAAQRFERAWGHVKRAYEGLGTDECPRIKEKDEIVTVLGMVSGMLALLHDRAGGGTLDIPLDRPLEVARATRCLPDHSWWSVPVALRAAAWATVPGSAPEGVDPWALLAESAAKGDVSGARVARAMQVLIGANSGKTDVVEQGIRAFAAVDAPPDPDWVLLDAYGAAVVLHQSDLLWVADRGHRTETLGVLPSDGASIPEALAGDDDPFGQVDPFGETPEGTDEQEKTP